MDWITLCLLGDALFFFAEIKIDWKYRLE
jgi:hypothetical protein